MVLDSVATHRVSVCRALSSFMTPPRYILKFVLLITCALFVLPGALLLWLLGGAVADPVSGFEERKGELVSASQTSIQELPDSTLREISLLSSSGLEVEIALREPTLPLPGKPLLVIMGGQETGRAAAHLIPEVHGVTVAALSYPFGVIAHRDGLAMTLALRRIQRGILDTTPSVMLALDYLLAQPGLGTNQVELAGISFGAFIASVPGAIDERFQRVWLIHGATQPARVIENGLEGRMSPRWLRQLVANTLAFTAAAHHLSSEHWVREISPRPVMVISASSDDAVPEDTVSALHARLRQPYEIFWTEGQHVHPKRPEVVQAIVDIMFGRIVTEGTRVQ